MYTLNRIKRFFKRLNARTIVSYETHSPIYYEPYNSKSSYYIINNNSFHIYNTEELYKLYTTTKKDPFTNQPIHTHEIVRILLKQ
jgi:hypothetical protein